MNNIALEPYNDEYKHYIKKWERKSEIYSFLTHSKPKCLENGDTCHVEKTQVYMIICDYDVIGITWLEDITDTEGKLSLYIGEVDYRGKGIGFYIISRLLDIAFKDLNLKSVYLNVRGKNKRAIQCYEKAGFEIEESYRPHRFPDGTIQNSFKMRAYK